MLDLLLVLLHNRYCNIESTNEGMCCILARNDNVFQTSLLGHMFCAIILSVVSFVCHGNIGDLAYKIEEFKLILGGEY